MVVFAQNDTRNWAIKKGVDFTTGVGFNYKEIGLDYPGYSWDQTGYFNFRFGSRWYIKPQEKWALGIKCSWIDFSYLEVITYNPDQEENLYEVSGEDVENNKLAILSIFSVGPIGTYAIRKNLAVDVYYQIQPSYAQGTPSLGDVDKEPGFGFSNLFGGSFRIGVFNIGVERVWGKIGTLSDKIGDAVSGIDENEGDDFPKSGDLNLNHLRLVVGCKF